MAITWKKVLMDGDNIPITDGGTGLTAIPPGVLFGSLADASDATSSQITGIELGAGKIVVGAGAGVEGLATGFTPPAGGDSNAADVGFYASGGTAYLALGNGKVTTAALATSITSWPTHEQTEANFAGGIPTYVTQGMVDDDAALTLGDPFILAPPVSSATLKFDGSDLVWSTSDVTSTLLAIDSVSDAFDYDMSFVGGTDPATSTDVTASNHKVDSDGVFTYNPSTNKLSLNSIVLDGTGNSITATTFNGTATTATQVNTIATSANSTFYPSFVDSNNNAATAEALSTSNILNYIPSTGILSATIFNGDLTGNATSATTADLATYATTAGHATTADSATYATTAGTAEIATNVMLTLETANIAHNLVFAAGASTGNADGLEFSSGLLWNSTGAGTLTVPNLVVSGTTTSINTTSITVEDANITLATHDAASLSSVVDDSILAGAFPGIDLSLYEETGVDTGEFQAVVSANVPSIRYKGQNNATTPSGWAIAKSGDAAGGVVAVSMGIAAMTVAIGSTLDQDTTSYGMGAFHLASDGLYIQIGV